MRKNIRAAAALLAVCTALSGCTLLQPAQIEVEQITFPTTTEPVTEPLTEPTTEAATEPSTEPTTAETTVQNPEATTYSNARISKGYTDNGYEIVERGGVTYVDTSYGDVLIANKTYGVPESYGPGDLTPECAAAYDALVSGAANDGIEIVLISGFRSYELQSSLYARYCASDGQALADTYSARPGHSEHQTGLAIDVNSLSYTFADTPEGRWLAAHAHEYGFIIRYAKEKESLTGYSYEPWHIRYLGVGLATDVYNSGLCLEEYFGISSRYE